MCDKATRKSKGVTFINFLKIPDAHSCVEDMNDKQLFGRTIKASIAKDNGRSTEFIRRRDYNDKSRCYQCGEFGHLSYKCTQNVLGDRTPQRKPRKRQKSIQELDKRQDDFWDDEETHPVLQHDISLNNIPRKKFRKSSYLSDEEELEIV